MSGNKPKVLVVEDSPPMRYALARLVEQCGLEAETAGTVAEAVRKLDCCGHLLLDLNLPDGVGTTVLQHAHAAHLTVKVAVVSGSPDGDLLALALRLGVEVVLPKPPDVERLRAWLSGGTGPAPALSGEAAASGSIPPADGRAD